MYRPMHLVGTTIAKTFQNNEYKKKNCNECCNDAMNRPINLSINVLIRDFSIPH